MSVNTVRHTVNAVNALHKRNEFKRSHDIIADRREFAETQSALRGQIICFNIELDPFFGKKAFPDFYEERSLTVFQFRKRQTKRVIVRNYLKKSAFSAAAMKRRDKGDSMIFSRALKIPALEIFVFRQWFFLRYSYLFYYDLSSKRIYCTNIALFSEIKTAVVAVWAVNFKILAVNGITAYISYVKHLITSYNMLIISYYTLLIFFCQ